MHEKENCFFAKDKNIETENKTMVYKMRKKLI